MTIAIPVYATPAALLDACLRSIAAAKRPGDEVFVVADGPQSPDFEGVISSVRTFGFEVVRQTTRLGLVANWNACLRSGSRELVHVMHADDAVDPEFYVAVGKAMQLGNVAAVAAGRFPSAGSGALPVLHGRAAASYLLSHEKPPTGSFVLRRSALGTPARGFDARFPYCPDEELFLRALASGDLALIDHRLYLEAHHLDQARYSTWHRADFADVYYAARAAGARTVDIDLVREAREQTSRRLLSVGRFLCGTRDGRAARAVVRSIAAHDKRTMANWKYWALLLLATVTQNSVPPRTTSTPATGRTPTSPFEWDERALIGPRTGWFWDPLGSQHVARYLWARSLVGRGLILDVACGTGYGSALLAGPGRRVLGIDTSAEAIDQANRDYGSSSGVSFMVGDAVRLPVASSSVDFVVSFETIEHLSEPAEFVAEVARVLRPRGTVLLSTPDRAVYSRGRTDGRSNNPFHPSEMTRSELLEVLQTRLVLCEVLGQSASRRNGSRGGGGQEGDWGYGVRTLAKEAVKLLTAPAVRNDLIARWLFPRIRSQYLPVSPTSGEYTYIVVRAEKL